MRLREDYNHICFVHRLKLRNPVIEVTELGRLWGQWDPESRTIRMSLNLIENYPWDMVLEILRHEMAHQIVTDQFGSDEAHGPLFRRACGMLGTAAWAIRAESETSELNALLKDQQESPPEDRLLVRVEKLLALATSSNEHEALAAMRKVRELYARYNIERIEQGTPTARDEMVTVLIKTGKKRVERYQSVIASILHEHFFVEVVHSSLYDAKDCTEYKVIELLGTKTNVAMAEYVFHFLSNQVMFLWNGFRLGTGQKIGKERRHKSSYLLGVLNGFRDRMESDRKIEQRSASMALVVPADPALVEFLSYRHPRLVHVGGGKRFHDSKVFEAGRSEGLRLILKKGVSEAQGNRGKLLR